MFFITSATAIHFFDNKDCQQVELLHTSSLYRLPNDKDCSSSCNLFFKSDTGPFQDRTKATKAALNVCMKGGSTGVLLKKELINNNNQCLCTLQDTLWRMDKKCDSSIITRELNANGNDAVVIVKSVASPRNNTKGYL
ncbi:predicted protein [Plenodomus lingam JN3]|uniref:Predicted protein n=1 Tax=Leptosphaeria maculans (strain JN3 / isolate v23.1.3 / race Av1-4-5-6-7-8) TaxID=985895 RepID=E5A2M1_LEPMJ|nr:predicted protein [Plenodomus lingam JN3]CBX97817.1 predicted protein [Plenodomus lingam JN3]